MALSEPRQKKSRRPTAEAVERHFLYSAALGTAFSPPPGLYLGLEISPPDDKIAAHCIIWGPAIDGPGSGQHSNVVVAIVPKRTSSGEPKATKRKVLPTLLVRLGCRKFIIFCRRRYQFTYRRQVVKP